MDIFESVARQRPVSLSVPGSPSTVLRVTKGARQKFLAGNESRGNRSGSSFVLLAWKWQREFIVRIYKEYTAKISAEHPQSYARYGDKEIGATRFRNEQFWQRTSSGINRSESDIFHRFLRICGIIPTRSPRSLLSLFRLSHERNELFLKGISLDLLARKLWRVVSQWSWSTSQLRTLLLCAISCFPSLPASSPGRAFSSRRMESLPPLLFFFFIFSRFPANVFLYRLFSSRSSFRSMPRAAPSSYWKRNRARLARCLALARRRLT